MAHIGVSGHGGSGGVVTTDAELFFFLETTVFFLGTSFFPRGFWLVFVLETDLFPPGFFVMESAGQFWSLPADGVLELWGLVD